MNAFDALDNAPPPAVKGAVTFDDMDTAPPPQVAVPQVSGTGQSVEPVSGWAQGWKNFTAHWTLGASSITKAGAGWQLATDDSKTFEDAQHDVMTDTVVQAQHDAEDYGNGPGFVQAAQKFGGMITEQLPTMGLGAGGASLGAGAALLAGGVAAGPLVLGAAAGGAVVFGSVAAGHAVYDLMQRGVDRNSARVAGLAAGIANAAITYASGGALGKGATEAGAMVMQSPPVKQAVLEVAKRLAANTGVQIGAGELSALADGVMKYVATQVSTGAKRYTGQEALDDFTRASMQTFMTAPFMSATGELTGAVVGRVFKGPAERAKAMQDWFNRESAAIQQKHMQNLMTNAAQVLQSPLIPTIKAAAIKQLMSDSERAKLVDTAALAAKAKPKANPAQGQAAALSDNPLENKERLSGFVTKTSQKIMPWSREFGQPSVTQEGQLAIAFQDTPGFEDLATKFGTTEAVEAVATHKREYTEIYNKNMEKATGLTPAKVQDLAHKALTDDLTVNHTDASGKQSTFELNADEAISFLLWSDNQDAQAALFEPFHLSKDGTKIGNGFSLDTVAKMKDALYDADKQYLSALDGLKGFYDEIGPILKNDYETIYPGETLNLQHNYGGSIHRDGATEVTANPDKLRPLIPGGEIRNPSFTNQRGPSKVQIQPRGAFQNAASRIRQQAQWRGMAEHAPLWSDLMENKPFKTAVETKFGKGLYKAIHQGYIDTVNGFGAEQGNKWLNNVMKARAFSKLAFKAMQMFKHMNTLINFSLFEFQGKPIPAADFTAGVLDAHAHWDAAVKQAFSWDEVKNRYANPEQILAQLNADSMTPGEARVQRAFMKPFELGDQYALIAGTHMVYKYVLKETGDAKLAKGEAVKAFKNFLASGSMDQQSALGRTSIGKAALQFKQPETRLAQNNLESWRRAANFPTPENVAKAVRTHMLTAVASAFFVLPETLFATGAGMMTGNMADAAEKQFRFWQHLTLSNQFPVIGDLLTSVHTVAVNNAEKMVTGTNPNHRVFDFTVAPADSIESAVKLVGDAAKWIDGEGSLKLVYKTVLDSIGAANLVGKGFPEAPIRGADWASSILGLE